MNRDNEKSVIIFTGTRKEKIGIYSGYLPPIYEIKYSVCPLSTMTYIREIGPDNLGLVIIIWDFPNMFEGKNMLAMIRRQSPSTPIVVIMDSEVGAEHFEPYVPEHVLCEPFNISHFIETVDALVHHYNPVAT